MKFFTISDTYLDYLRTVDSKVPNSYGREYTVKKPYVGVVFEIKGHEFLAPLSSPKPQHDKIQSSDVTVFKIYDRQNKANKLGIIALKFMIPCVPGVASYLDFSLQSPDYRNLLQLQYEYIKTKSGKIQSRAEKLYESVVTNPKPYLKGVTCDFAKLIKHSEMFVQP